MRNQESGGKGFAFARPGFTLIELLVVISLIALLMGILLPLLGKSRRVGLTGACLSNQRQLAVAIESFTQENDGRYPPRISYDGSGELAALDPDIVTAQNGEAEGIPLPPLGKARESRRQVWMSAALRQISVATYVYNTDDTFKRISVPGLVCPADPDPTGPQFGEWTQIESADRSYVFNGFNDFPQVWNFRDSSEVPRDILVKPWHTALFGEKKSETGRESEFYVDLFNRPGLPLDTLVQDRHDSGGVHAFADGSARLFKPWESLSPENLWGIFEKTRNEYTYSYDQDRSDQF